MLMRAGGIPARIVTGYLGGEWNPLGSYLIVRQSDAHAWAEVWLEGRGWTRVDPTSVVAPERLERGILDLMPDAVSASERLIHRLRWLTFVSQGWDAANAWWALQVVGFNLRSQLGLLERLGVKSPDWPQLGAALAFALIVWLGVIGWRSRRTLRPVPPDRLARAYRRLCAKLAASGCPREPHQGPMAYVDSIALHRPRLAEAVRPLLEAYTDLRFGAAAALDPRTVAEFERAVARLRIRRRFETGGAPTDSWWSRKRSGPTRGPAR
jgi:hypothetical protein